MTRNDEKKPRKSGRRREDQEVKVRLTLVEIRQDDLEKKFGYLNELVGQISEKIQRNSKEILRAGHEIEKKVMDRIERTTWQIILTFVGGMSSLAIAMLIVWVER